LLQDVKCPSNSLAGTDGKRIDSFGGKFIELLDVGFNETKVVSIFLDRSMVAA